MFENKTYESILNEIIDSAPKDIDTRQGSIFYDAVSGAALKIAELYANLDLVSELTQVDTTSGEYLDIKASEYGLTRHGAVSAKYAVTFTGTTPDIGERFFSDNEYFVLGITDSGTLYLQAETPGTRGNTVQSGTPAIPVNNIAGLESAVFGAILEYGTDAESDDSLRQRVQEKIGGPAENGNKQHYKTWCESFDGVGKARIFPLWNGPNTVKAVLINPLGLPCSSELVSDVQEYVDPAAKGYTAVVGGVTYVAGDGLGEGAANLGAHFTAVSAEPTDINVTFTAELAKGYSMEEAKAEAERALTAYLKNIVLTTEDFSDVVVRYSAVGALIASLKSVVDYSGLSVNSGTENITPGADSIPVPGEVVVNAV